MISITVQPSLGDDQEAEALLPPLTEPPHGPPHPRLEAVQHDHQAGGGGEVGGGQ